MCIRDSIQTIRKLKEIGVGIYFEKENINTLSEKSELFITILASVAIVILASTRLSTGRK